MYAHVYVLCVRACSCIAIVSCCVIFCSSYILLVCITQSVSMQTGLTRLSVCEDGYKGQTDDRA